MADTVLAAAATVTVDGAELDEEMRGHIELVVVDDDVSLPTMFAVTLQDPELDVVAKSGMRVGAKVDIAYAGQGGADDPICSGEVVTIECDYDAFGNRVVVRGYSPSHRLHSGRRTRAFVNVTDSDIVNQVAEDAGVDLGLVQDTDEVHDHVTQANVSDWEFLSTRARAIGFDLAIVDGKLTFGRSPAAATAPAESAIDDSPEGRDERVLVYGENLLSFHGRISAAEQVSSVEVRGWDDTQKQAIVASVDARTEAAKLNLADPATLAGFFGNPKLVSVDQSITTDGAANTAAKALGERLGSAFAKADGVAVGNAKLKAGTAVRIGKLSEDFNGAYVLTQVRHVIDGFGFRTHFTIGGRQAQSIPEVPATASTEGGDSIHRLPGIVRAIVEENDDPDSQGRVKVSFPWLDEDYKSDWAPVIQLGAGPKSGTFFLPAVKDEVLCGFEQGNVGRPIVLGGLFNGQDDPPTYSQWLKDGAVNGRGIYSRTGHFLEFWDDDKDVALLSTSNGNASIALDHGDQKVVIQSDGAIEITAQAELKIRASKITLEADGNLVLKGAQISLN
ncbi:MAG TPA: VgrG-related protein [Candidatus Limnocylindrales bacterium]|nr:VgrG-related protein [Candidatus Limnocylindrales bacterium]